VPPRPPISQGFDIIPILISSSVIRIEIIGESLFYVGFDEYCSERNIAVAVLRCNSSLL